MGLNNQPTLIQFENTRKDESYIPLLKSNIFFNVGDGKINLFTLKDNPDDYQFDIYIDKGHVYTGAGNFYVMGGDTNIENPYRNMTIINAGKLTVNQFLTVKGGKLNTYGTLELLPYSQLIVEDDGEVVTNHNSVLIVNDRTNINVIKGKFTIYGRIDIHLSIIRSILDAHNIIIDSAAVLNISGIPYKDRTYSLIDYEHELRNKAINIHTQGEKNFDYGRLGYTWKNGSPSEHSQNVEMRVLLGEFPLGDFRLSVVGIPNHTYQNMYTTSDLTVLKYTTLHITESYNDFIYIRPELYIGIIIENTKIPAKCTVLGRIVTDGANCMITIDRGGMLIIEEGGEVVLKNGAIMRCTHTDDLENREVLIINGSLIIDRMEELQTFSSENIIFGKHGKLIVMNPETENKRLLFTTPNGIKESDLYKVFLDKIDHVEYHISKNNGFGIDKYYENYPRDMTEWFGNRRFEKAIHDGILVWHPGAFIELYSWITPWINEHSTLISIGKIFKCFGSYDLDKLQDAVNRLEYAGCKDILFRFTSGKKVGNDIWNRKIGEVLLQLEHIHMKLVVNNTPLQRYTLTTDNDGLLFLRNKINKTDIQTLIHPYSRVFEVPDENRVEFALPYQ